MKALSTFSLLAALCVGGCRAPQTESRPSWPPLVTAELGSMQTVGLAENLWFGSRPSPEDLELAARRGVEQVIDLCDSDSPELERAASELGLAWTSTTDTGEILALLAVDHSALMFCEDGSASAALFAIHRVLHVGVPLDAALEEARRAGLEPGAGEELVRRAVNERAAP